MTQSVFDQHAILDKIYLLLKSAYQKGEIATYEQLLKIAPNLSNSEYEIVIERFKTHVQKQGRAKDQLIDNKFSLDEHIIEAKNSFVFDQEHLNSQLLVLQQDFCQKVGLLISSHEKKITQESQGIIEELNTTKLALEQELKVAQINYEQEKNSLSFQIEQLKKQVQELQEHKIKAQQQSELIHRDFEALSLLKLLSSDHGIEILESLPFHPSLNPLIVDVINQTKELNKDQTNTLSLLLNIVLKVADNAHEAGVELSKLSAQKYENIIKEKQQETQSKNNNTLSEQERELIALKEKFKNIEQLGADNSYFLEDDSFNKFEDPDQKELLSDAKSDISLDVISSLKDKALSLSSSAMSNNNDIDHMRIIEGLNVIANDLLAKKSVSELSYSDIGQALQTAVRMEIGAQDQIDIMSRLLIKIIFLGVKALKESDFTISEDELLASLNSEEQRTFARNTFSWLKINLNKKNECENPLASLMPGATAKGRDSYNVDYQNKGFDSQNGTVEIINSSAPKAIPRDEGTLVREMSVEGGDDNIAAFAAASAKIASLAPLLHDASKELKQAQKELESELEKSQLTERFLNNKEDSKTSCVEDNPFATTEIASVAKDVVKVAAELEQVNDDRNNKKFSLFDNSKAATEQTGTTVFGVENKETSTNVSYDSTKENYIKQADIYLSEGDEDSLDDFITGNITDLDHSFDNDHKEDNNSNLSLDNNLDQEKIVNSAKSQSSTSNESLVNSNKEPLVKKDVTNFNKEDNADLEQAKEEQLNNKKARYLSTSTVSATGTTAIIKTTNIDDVVSNVGYQEHQGEANESGQSKLVDNGESNFVKKGNESTVITVKEDISLNHPSIDVADNYQESELKNNALPNNDTNGSEDRLNKSSESDKDSLSERHEATSKTDSNHLSTEGSLYNEQDNIPDSYSLGSKSNEQSNTLLNDGSQSQVKVANNSLSNNQDIKEEADLGFKLKTHLDEESKKRFKFFSDLIDNRISDRIGKVNIILHGSPENTNSLVQVKDVTSFYKYCINSLEMQYNLSPELKSALYEKMEYDLACSEKQSKENHSPDKDLPSSNTQNKPSLTKDICSASTGVNHQSYKKITTMVMPDLSKISGKPTINWDEFYKNKERGLKFEELEETANDSSSNVVKFSVSSQDNNTDLASDNVIEPSDSEMDEQIANRIRLLSMLGIFLKESKQDTPIELEDLTNGLIVDALNLPDNHLSKCKESTFTVVDENIDDIALDKTNNAHNEKQIIQRKVTFATLEDDSNELSEHLDKEDKDTNNSDESKEDNDTSKSNDLLLASDDKANKSNEELTLDPNKSDQSANLDDDDELEELTIMPASQYVKDPNHDKQ